ncbi:hypothetical protein GCM10022262_12270 [Georgenia daeguensis]|uniref:Transposase IS4-like domain-containing protein n=1 Tax=Georgenia daeguensis TaxID=908355 RepID=A0ABP8ESE9_9MICO
MFRDLVVARVVEPTSLLDAGRVLLDLGRTPASYATMKRTLARAAAGSYRDQIATACFRHAVTSGDVSLCLYDVTTLYFEAEKEDDLGKVGYSKERRVDPQIVVWLLVDRQGFPLDIGCWKGNTAEQTTVIPIVRAFQARHGIEDMVVVADAGMLSAENLRQLDEANLRFIVGSRVSKARWTSPRTSAGTATPSPTARSSTPSPRGPGAGARTRPRCGPNPSGTVSSIPAPGGRSGPTRASGPRGTPRRSPCRRTRPARSSPGRRPPAPHASSRPAATHALWTRPPWPGPGTWSG